VGATLIWFLVPGGLGIQGVSEIVPGKYRSET
jgi:uncharacterized membrane protein YjjB (DUF3815 family)